MAAHARPTRAKQQKPKPFWMSALETFNEHHQEEDYLISLTKRLYISPISVGIADTASVQKHKRKLFATAQRLQKDHKEHVLVWNTTRPEKFLFDPKEFSEQVLDVGKFPLYVPTLQFTFEFCNMIRYWLKQDPLNVAVIMYEDATDQPHVDPVRMAINYESRIAYLMSAFLAYSGETKTA
jgi:hypothetical protein